MVVSSETGEALRWEGGDNRSLSLELPTEDPAPVVLSEVWQTDKTASETLFATAAFSSVIMKRRGDGQGELDLPVPPADLKRGKVVSNATASRTAFVRFRVTALQASPP